MKTKTVTLTGITLVLILYIVYLVRKTDSLEQDLTTEVSQKETSPAVTSIANVLVNPNYVTTTSLVATTSSSDVKVTTSVKDTTDDDITKAVTEAVNKIVNDANNTETENNKTVNRMPSIEEVFNNSVPVEILTPSSIENLSDDELFKLMGSRGMFLIYLFAEKYETNWQRLSASVENSVRIELGNYRIIGEELLNRGLIERSIFISMNLAIEMYQKCTVNPNLPQCSKDYQLENELPKKYFRTYYSQGLNFSDYENRVIMPVIESLESRGMTLEAEFLRQRVIEEKRDHESRDYSIVNFDNNIFNNNVYDELIEEEIINNNNYEDTSNNLNSTTSVNTNSQFNNNNTNNTNTLPIYSTHQVNNISTTQLPTTTSAPTLTTQAPRLLPTTTAGFFNSNVQTTSVFSNNTTQSNSAPFNTPLMAQQNNQMNPINTALNTLTEPALTPIQLPAPIQTISVASPVSIAPVQQPPTTQSMAPPNFIPTITVQNNQQTQPIVMRPNNNMSTGQMVNNMINLNINM